MDSSSLLFIKPIVAAILEDLSGFKHCWKLYVLKENVTLKRRDHTWQKFKASTFFSALINQKLHKLDVKRLCKCENVEWEHEWEKQQLLKLKVLHWWITWSSSFIQQRNDKSLLWQFNYFEILSHTVFLYLNDACVKHAGLKMYLCIQTLKLKPHTDTPPQPFAFT